MHHDATQRLAAALQNEVDAYGRTGGQFPQSLARAQLALQNHVGGKLPDAVRPALRDLDIAARRGELSSIPFLADTASAALAEEYRLATTPVPAVEPTPFVASPAGDTREPELPIANDLDPQHDPDVPDDTDPA